MNKIKLWILVFVLVINSSISLKAENSASLTTKVYGIKKLIELNELESTIITVNTNEGLTKILLKKKKRVLPKGYVVAGESKTTIVPSNIVLYKGRVLPKSNRQAGALYASASIYKNKLKLKFQGNRKRSFQLELNLDNLRSSNDANARIYSVPASRLLNCADLPHDFMERASLAQTNDITSTRQPADTLTLQLGMDVDYQFFQANNSSSADTLASLEEIVNSVDSIYSNQLGINVVLFDYNIFTTSSQPYTSTNTNSLLTQFGNYLRDNSGHLNGDTRHLMTGKNTSYQGNSSIVGLAYLGVVCSSTTVNTGLSERTSSAIQHLVVAHELGHNFNANHDDATPSIMSSSVSSSRDTFSNYTINEIETFLSGNTECLEDGDDNGGSDDVALSVKLNKSNRFRFTVTPNGFSTTACTVNIYGAKNTTELNSTPTLILSRAGNSASGEKQTFSFNNSKRTPKNKVYFKAIVDCGSTEYNSSSKSLKANAGTELRSVNVSRFINYLINKFN